MRLGTENRTKTIAAIALMVVAVVFVVVRLIPDSPAAAKTPAPVVVPPPGTRRIVTVRAPGKKPAVSADVRSLDPTLRYDWLKASEDTKYQGAGRNIFRAEVEIPKPIVPVHIAAPVVPQGPPPPPPINLKFFGFANNRASRREYSSLKVKMCSLPARATLSIAVTGFCTSRRFRWKWKMC